jgi:hypothetical protein
MFGFSLAVSLIGCLSTVAHIFGAMERKVSIYFPKDKVFHISSIILIF